MRELAHIVLFGANARTTTANGTGQGLAGYTEAGGREMQAFLDIGATSGTPTLDVKIQESDTVGGTYTDITGAVFPQKSAVGNDTIHFQAKKAFIRAVATIGGGTPSLTFGVYVLATKRIQ